MFNQNVCIFLFPIINLVSGKFICLLVGPKCSQFSHVDKHPYKQQIDPDFLNEGVHVLGTWQIRRVQNDESAMYY